MTQDRLVEADSLIAESIKLRQELGESISLAQSELIDSAILMEENKTPAAERAARDAAATFHRAGAWGSEAEAAVAIARAQLAGGDAARARATLDGSEKLLRDSKDARLLLRRDITQADILYALGRRDESAAILDKALAEAGRIGLTGVALEIRLEMVRAGRTPAPQLASDARNAEFLSIARKAMTAKGAPAGSAGQ